MFFMFTASREYQIRSENISVRESIVYEATKSITYKPCEVIPNYVVPEKLMESIIQSENLRTELKAIQLHLYYGEIVTFRKDIFYRSEAAEDICALSSTYDLFSLECEKDGHKIYTNISSENYLYTTSSGCLDSLRKASVNCCYRHANMNSLPVYFTGMASSVLSHELFGHIFEVDNYYIYKYENVIRKIEKLKISLKDCPNQIPQLGVSVKDDALMSTSKTVIFDNGCFSGLLIGGTIDKTVCVGNLRRERLSVQAMPRITTLVLESNNLNNMKESYVRVTGIDRAFIDHGEKRIDLNINNAEVVIQGEAVQTLPPVLYTCSINDMLSKVISMPSSTKKIYTSRCYKKGQVINCGTISDDWMLPTCGDIWGR